MDKNGLLINFLLGLVNWFLAGIHAQTVNSMFPEGCTNFPASWAADGDATNAAKDWYCGKTAHTTYTFNFGSAAVTPDEEGWVTSAKKFTLTFAQGARPTFTATNSCPVDESEGECTEANLYLSATVDADPVDGSPLKVAGVPYYGWLQWKCTVTATSRTIYYGFPIEKDTDSTDDSFMDADAAAVLNSAYVKAVSVANDGLEGHFPASVTDLNDDLANWKAATFDKVNDAAPTYIMMNGNGELYKVFTNVTLQLSAAIYGKILHDGAGAAQQDGSSADMSGPTVGADCAKVFKLNTGEVCTACEQKCGAMQIAPKMILSLLTILLLQCFK